MIYFIKVTLDDSKRCVNAIFRTMEEVIQTKAYGLCWLSIKVLCLKKRSTINKSTQ